MKNEQERTVKENVARAAGWAVTPVLAIFVAPVMAAMNMHDNAFSRYKDNITPEYKGFGKYYRECLKNFVLRAPDVFGNIVKSHDKEYLAKLAAEKKCAEKTNKELAAIQDIIHSVLKYSVFTVNLFEETEHQKKHIKRIETFENIIEFGGNGTDWCGGVRGNGYVFKKSRKNGQDVIEQIAVLSPDASERLHDIILTYHKTHFNKDLLDNQKRK